MQDQEKINTILNRGVEEVVVKESLQSKLNSGKKLVIKLGIDPTGSELHLGHAVVLRKLKQFQDLGHEIVLIIGDFTALIGDPSGRTKERNTLNEDEINKNMETYKDQAGKILDLNKVRIEKNSKWLGELGVKGLFELASKATLAQIMERKEFRIRMENDVDIPYLEMFYPLMQGYDSVALKADVELGGSDQKFNLLMGRQIQKRYDQPEQDVLMVKLLLGTDGAKMSKSAGNYISLTATPNDMYGKIMSISDEVLNDYFELCTDVPLKDIPQDNPYEAKKLLARTLVSMYHNENAANEAEKVFFETFRKGKINEEAFITVEQPAGEYKWPELIVSSGGTTSSSMAKELLRNKAVTHNGNIPVMDNWNEVVKFNSGDTIQIGKRRLIKII